MSQDAHVREQMEAAEREMERLKTGGKVLPGRHPEHDNTAAQIKSQEAIVAEQPTRLKRLKQQSN